MNITSKSRYALKIMMDLCEHQGPLGGVVQRSDIAVRQGIPLDYMDHILSRLREAGLLTSTRGRSGGYRLTASPQAVSVWQIFMAVEDTFQPVQCLDSAAGAGCVAEHVCSVKDAWGLISSAIQAALSGIILDDLVQRKGLAKDLKVLLSRTQECRAPKRRAGGLRSP